MNVPSTERVVAFDGLRAVACLLVLGRHCHVPGFAAGWLGVDVFFVLSGYLITRLLLAERDAGGLRLGRFYLRRAARLYPALVVTAAVCFVVPTRTTSADAVVALVYASDVWRSTHDLGGLGHTWSLAVEEQFYLVWPLVLLACRSRRAVALASWAGIVASLSILLLVSPPGHTMAGEAYFSPVTRLWELLVGCLAAALPAWRPTGRTSVALSGGAGAIAVGIVVRWHGHPHVDASLVVAIVVATVALIPALQAGGPVSRVLSLPPLPQLGLISYGIYLFHYPIARAASGEAWPVRTAVTVAGTLGLAVLSYLWIERPLRRAVRTGVTRHRGVRLEARPV